MSRALTPFDSLAEQLRRARREGVAFDDVFPAACKAAVELESTHTSHLRYALRSTRETWRRCYELFPVTPTDEAAKALGRILLDDPHEPSVHRG
jgi:hypothetical protein